MAPGAGRTSSSVVFLYVPYTPINLPINPPSAHSQLHPTASTPQLQAVIYVNGTVFVAACADTGKCHVQTLSPYTAQNLSRMSFLGPQPWLLQSKFFPSTTVRNSRASNPNPVDEVQASTGGCQLFEGVGGIGVSEPELMEGDIPTCGFRRGYRMALLGSRGLI